MRTTIDRGGRVVIPKALRDRLALTGGEELEINESGGRIEIERPPDEAPLVSTPVGLKTMATGPGLGPDEVRALLEHSRR